MNSILIKDANCLNIKVIPPGIEYIHCLPYNHLYWGILLHPTAYFYG